MHRGLSGLDVEPGLLQLLERDRLVRVEILVAHEDGLLAAERGSIAGQVGRGVGRVGARDRQQRLADLDAIALVDEQLRDLAAHERRDLAGLERIERDAGRRAHRPHHRLAHDLLDVQPRQLVGRDLEQRCRVRRRYRSFVGTLARRHRDREGGGDERETTGMQGHHRNSSPATNRTRSSASIASATADRYERSTSR